MQGCKSPHVATQVVERTRHDSLLSATFRHDSIYIHETTRTTLHPAPVPAGSACGSHPAPSPCAPQFRCGSHPSPDTLLIETTRTEYRYRLLHDTLRITATDTIPVVHEVEVVRRERYTPWPTKILAWTGIILLATMLLRLCMKAQRL